MTKVRESTPVGYGISSLGSIVEGRNFEKATALKGGGVRAQRGAMMHSQRDGGVKRARSEDSMITLDVPEPKYCDWAGSAGQEEGAIQTWGVRTAKNR